MLDEIYLLYKNYAVEKYSYQSAFNPRKNGCMEENMNRKLDKEIEKLNRQKQTILEKEFVLKSERELIDEKLKPLLKMREQEKEIENKMKELEEKISNHLDKG